VFASLSWHAACKSCTDCPPSARYGREPASQRGLTLIELLIILAVVATLTTIALLYYGSLDEGARDRPRRRRHRNHQRRDRHLRMMNERLPSGLAEIGRATLKDRWGNPYEYLDYSTGPAGQIRKDHALHPLNSSYDLYSKGKDGASQPPLTAAQSRDEIVRANDGGHIGLASKY
jgi:general secretion pathway protein G